MRVPLLDLCQQYSAIKSDVDTAVAELFHSQKFILGAAVEEFEAALSKYCHSKYSIGVSSGTDALILCLMAEGVGPGDEVITTPYSFFATAGSIVRLGATPVFVDIKPDTYNMDPDLVRAAITKRTKAIMPVHLYGQLADMAELCSIADEAGIAIIEDACQAIGAEHEGRRAGSIGKYGCFSFFPSKNLGGAGDGGLVTVNDPEIARQLKALRNHGAFETYHHKWVGGNFRLDALQAVVINAKLKYLDSWTEARQDNAELYNKLFAQKGLTSKGQVGIPVVETDRHVYNQYVIRAKNRDKLKEHLTANQVGCAIYYPLPLHLQECFKSLGYKVGDMPHSERAALETLALPIYPELSDEQINYVVNTIEHFYSEKHDARSPAGA